MESNLWFAIHLIIYIPKDKHHPNNKCLVYKFNEAGRVKNSINENSKRFHLFRNLYWNFHLGGVNYSLHELEKRCLDLFLHKQ